MGPEGQHNSILSGHQEMKGRRRHPNVRPILTNGQQFQTIGSQRQSGDRGRSFKSHEVDIERMHDEMRGQVRVASDLVL